MGSTYTRQSTFTDGDTITADLFNTEFDQLVAAFAATSGHSHDGTAGEGGPIGGLITPGITLGDNTIDVTLTFDGGSNDGVLKWMEDEDYFEFSDDILIASTEKLQFHTAANYINSGATNHLDLVAGEEIHLTANTINIDGAVALNGAITGATNITLSGELDAATLDISGNADIDGNLDIGGTLGVTGVLTTTATQVATGGITSGSNIVSDTDSTDDLGTTSVRWANLFVDGITATDQITATGFTGTLDGILGSGTAAAATVTTLDTSGAVNLNLVTDSTSSTSGALIVDGGVGIAKKLFVGTDLDVDGTTNLDGAVTVGADDQGYDVILYGDTASANITWDTSADDLIFNGVAGLIVPEGQLTLGSDAVTATADELNILDGKAFFDEDNFATNSATGIASQQSIKAYVDASAGSNIVATGALNSGSITSGFGSIDNGSSDITTTGLISGGSLDIDNVLINGATIGHTNDTDLITLAADLVTVAGEVSMTTLDIGGTNVTADAGELNTLDGITAVVGELNALDLGDTAIGTAIASKAVVLNSNKDYTGIRNFTITGNLSVGGTTTVVDTVTMNAQNAVLFEGTTADDFETTLSIVDPTADRTIKLPDQSGTIPVLAAVSDIAITSTPAELNILDASNSTIGTLGEISTVANDDVFLALDTSDNGGVLKRITRSAVVSGLATSSGLSNVVEDTTPQLGGNLDTNSQNILIDDAHFIGDESGNEQLVFQTTGSAVNQLEITNAATGNGPILASTGGDANINLNLTPKGTGVVMIDGTVGIDTGKIDLKNSGTASQILFYCESSNAHAQTLQGAPHSQTADNTLLLPDGDSGTLLSTVSTATVTNKTLTAPKIADGGFIADANGNELVVFQTTGSAVNELEITNNASGSNPIIAATGGDTNIGITLTPKGTGEIVIGASNLNYGGAAITATGAELSKMAGGTSPTSTTVVDADRVVMNDDGTMVQVAVTDLAAYFDDEITAMPNLITTAATTVGALDSGSITSNFGTIDTGASAITTTGLITGGSLTVDDVGVDGKVITMTGSSSDTAVFTVGTNGTLSIVTTDADAAAANIQITADGTAELAGTTVTLDSGGDIDLAATDDINIPSGVGLTFGDDGEKIEGNGTDLTITSGAKINLTATSDVHIPNNVGIVFGGDSEKIEGDGTDLTIAGNNINLTADVDVIIDAAADIVLDAAGGNIEFKDAGTLQLTVDMDGTAGAQVVKLEVDNDDLIFKQYDGTTVLTLDDDTTVKVATDLTVGDDVSLISDGAVLAFGENSEVTLTHVHDAGLLLNVNRQLQFRDSAINIRSDADGDLDINADDEIELNSTLIDVNGNLDVSGTIVGASTLSATTGTFSGILKTDDATEATSTTDGSLQTDGGLSVVKDAVFGDDIKLLSDASVIHFGADSEVTLTHTADTGLALKHTATADDKPIVLTLQTGETDIAANDELGVINFQAPNEGAGTDAILVAAGIAAVSEGDFSASNNATKLSFRTGASEAASEKMSLSSAGLLTIADDFIIKDGGTIGSASDVDAITIASNGQVTFTQKLIGTELDISGNIDVDGTSNLDVVDIDGAVDMASTLAVAGVVTANAGVVVDNITIDGTEIDLSSGDLTIDVAGDIILDAAGDDILLKSGGTHEGNINLASSNLTFKSIVSDKDIIFQGNDGGSGITALTLDMSAAGAATFNNDVTAFSDERLKSNITTIPDALSKVTEMRGVHYVRDATGKDSTGVIAQEMQKVAPELVLTADDAMGTLSVNYGNITGYLIEAIKELKAEIKELKER